MRGKWSHKWTHFIESSKRSNSVPESEQAEVLDFVERLTSRKDRKDEDSEWSMFSLSSALKGIEEEPSPYGVDDIKESFS